MFLLKINTAVILATDWNKKFYPYTVTKPKHLIHIASKPLIQVVIEQLTRKSIKNIIVVLQSNDQKTKQKILTKLTKNNNKGKDVNLNLVYIKDPSGSADALEKALPYLKGDTESFLVIYGDILTNDDDLEKILNKAESGSGEAYVLIDKLGKLRASDWICANGEKELDEIIFHPRRGAKYRLGGVFALTEKVIKFLELTPIGTTHAPTGVMPTNERFLEETLAQMVENGENVIGVEVDNFLVDLDKPWHILEANEKYLDYLASKAEESFFGENVEISERVVIGEKIVIGDGAKIGANAVIQEFTIIGKKAEISNAIIQGKASIGDETKVGEYSKIWKHTSIGSRVRILHCADVAGVIMDKVSIMHHAYIHGVLGESVDIGAGTVTGDLRFNDLPPLKYTEGRREQESPYMNAVFIGDHVRTGINVSINPGVRIGPYTVIGPGAIIYKDVEPRKKILVKQSFDLGEWSEKKYGF